MSNVSFVPVREVLHGVPVFDPYRWLEDRDVPETESWIREQQRRCDEYFARIAELGSLHERVRAYLDVEVIDQPTRVKGVYFYRKRAKGQEQFAICLRDTTTAEERLLIDPSPHGPFVSLHIYRISTDASLLAYEVKCGGEDRKAIHLLDAETATLLPDKLDVGYARGFVFTPHNDGFYYCHETGDNLTRHEIKRHLFGQSTSQDQVVFHAERSAGSRLILTADDVHLGAIWVHPDEAGTALDFAVSPIVGRPSWRTVFSNKRVPSNPILCQGRILLLAEGSTANSKTVLELSEDGEELREIIPPRSSPIRQLAITRRIIFAAYLEDGVPSIHAWSLAGRALGTIDIPSDGSIQLLPSASPNQDAFFYSYETFSQPPSIYEYACNTGRSALWHSPTVPFPGRRANVQTTLYSSKDKTKVPLTLVSLEDRTYIGFRPVIMTSYGGFGVPMTPQFSVLVTVMMELGAIFALPHIRGGGEFGRPWHDAGRARNRQNAFDDFLAAAEWLCDQKVTTPKRLAIFGGSNAGLLVGAAMTQRPDLFGAVLCITPLLDMVRYELFDQALRWRAEYGTVKDPDDFCALYAYSPYHQVKDADDYPPVMFVSGDKDDRCNPAHVRKMVARLQNRPIQHSTIIVDYNDQRGHSAVLPLSTRIDALSRRIAFLGHELSIFIASGGGHEAPGA